MPFMAPPNEEQVRENIPPSCADKFPTGFKDDLGRAWTQPSHQSHT